MRYYEERYAVMQPETTRKLSNTKHPYISYLDNEAMVLTSEEGHCALPHKKFVFVVFIGAFVVILQCKRTFMFHFLNKKINQKKYRNF
jgi:hypothetical protein